MAQGEIRVLIVEDDEYMRATLADFVSRIGVEILTAQDLPDALRLLKEQDPPVDIVLTDLKLPAGSGLEVVRAARARSPETLVSVVTGYASLETAIQAIRLGAYDYITKPFSLDQIGVQVRNMIGRISLVRENARLSVRLQELLQQVNRLQSEKQEMIRLQEEIHRGLQENSRKLDRLIEERSPNGAPPNRQKNEK